MKPSADAGRLSSLAVNPRNREASAARRTRLLAAFESLDEDTRADLLEAVESMASRPNGGIPGHEARRILSLMYAAAGWEKRS